LFLKPALAGRGRTGHSRARAAVGQDIAAANCAISIFAFFGAGPA
jgi:hypothetical protein